ncbi:MAG: hypothetical protein MRJ65_07890 [Candidatus Brocadiaceae bacterium]|nr:hypothetical protein [Candidatus Brocadiaceae bacterium]
MRRRKVVMVIPAVLSLLILLGENLPAGQDCVRNVVSKAFDQQTEGNNTTDKKAGVLHSTQNLRIPFIANEGQSGEQVKFYAKTFGGTVFVTKDGEIVYTLEEKAGEGFPWSREREAGYGPRVTQNGTLSARALLNLFLISVSRPRELPPQTLAKLNVKLSLHSASIKQTNLIPLVSNAQISMAAFQTCLS